MNETSKPEPTYLGDGLYAENDGYMLKLIANPGSPAEHTVYLEPSVYNALRRFAQANGFEEES